MADAPLATPRPSLLVGSVHVHSSYSHDGCDSLRRIRTWAERAGLRFVAMTDHAEDFDASRFGEYTAECAALSDGAVSIIPGLEFRFPRHRGLHLLACGLAGWCRPGTIEAYAREIPDRSRLTILAHPLLSSYQVPVEVRDCIDAIEVWNAAYNTRYLPDPRAIRLLHAVRTARPAVVGIAGLDQHDAGNDRRTRVVLTDNMDLADPLLAIRGGRFFNRGTTMTFGPTADLSPGGQLTLSVARGVLDRVERAQEALVHAWRRARARRPET